MLTRNETPYALGLGPLAGHSSAWQRRHQHAERRPEEGPEPARALKQQRDREARDDRRGQAAEDVHQRDDELLPERWILEEFGVLAEAGE